MPRISDKVKRELMELGTHPHVMEVARRVHPVWVAANGHRADQGVEHLAREIGQCIAAAHYAEEEGKDISRSTYVGHGIVVIRGPGIHGFSVAVIAGEVFDLSLEFVPTDPPSAGV
jgi:hypothetical protein